MTQSRVALMLSLLVGIMVLSACGGNSEPTTVANTAVPTSATAVGSGAISVSGAWLRMPAATDTPGAGYFLIRNTGPEDKLTGASSDIAAQVEMHQTINAGEMMQMSPVKFITVPANGQAELKPGGYHLMLIGLKRTLKVGEKAELNLTFEKTGMLFVAAEVRQ